MKDRSMVGRPDGKKEEGKRKKEEGGRKKEEWETGKTHIPCGKTFQKLDEQVDQ